MNPMNRRPAENRKILAAPLILVLVAGLVSLGCQTAGTPLEDRTTRDAVLGGLVGAAAGAAIDDNKRGRGALIGAGVGALAGGLIGNYLKKQEAEIDAIPDANVETREEVMIIGFPSDVLFDVGSFSLKPGAYSRLNSLADTLNRYPDTLLVVQGHTDGTGSEVGNQELSERRADAVRSYLLSQGVSPYRVTTYGFGESMPVATNDTAAGRQQNRRVEIEVRPNDSLREQAGSEGGEY